MGHTEYTAVPVEDRPGAEYALGAEDGGAGGDRRRPSSWCERAKQALYISSLLLLTLILGFCLGRKHEHASMGGGGGSGMSAGSAANGLLPPQAFVPESTCYGVLNIMTVWSMTWSIQSLVLFLVWRFPRRCSIA